ncbi:uncharacterized protein [Eurosta solidaginis]|uniref:uncharacterized protein isoform X2 n=1 Tax=Eurosta solidaginis TaxID=178769 RepID=UPI0035312BE9
MELQYNEFQDTQKEDPCTIDTGHLLRATSIILNKDTDEENDALEALNALECSKCQQCAHCSNNIKALTNTVRLTMLEINDIKEQHRERRHREFIELLEKYFGSDKPKSPEILRNIKTEDNIGNKINDVTAVTQDTSSQISKNIKPSPAMSQSYTPIRKRLSESVGEDSNVGLPPKKHLKPQKCINIEDLKNATKKQRDELLVMRQKMLEMQRRKMEDRERKKREDKFTN